jgi:hypothetical protein
MPNPEELPPEVASQGWSARMCRPTWYALALFACIALLPAGSPGAQFPTESVRVVGTVARVLPNGFEIVLDRESADRSIKWPKDPITVTRSDTARIAAANPRDGLTVRVGAQVEVTGELVAGSVITADLVRILAAVAPAPSGRETAAGFTFDDIRVGAVSDDDGPGLTRVKTGTKFYPHAYITLLHPHHETYSVTFSVQFESEAPVETYHDTLVLPFISSYKLDFVIHGTEMQSTLAPGLERANVTVIGRITSEGVTQTRSASFVVVR